MIEVDSLDPGFEVPKTQLIEKLKEEAPQFMQTLFDLPLPEATGRLRIPIVATENKRVAEDSSRNPLERFLTDECQYAPGKMLSLSEFDHRLKDSLLPGEKFGKHSIGQNLPKPYLYGHLGSTSKYIGNIAWAEGTVDDAAMALQLVDGRLISSDDVLEIAT